jgi:hypothetical protein
MPSIIFNTNRTNLDIVAQGKSLPTVKELGSIIITFSLTVLAWIFFRSATIDQAVHYIAGIFSKSFFSVPHLKVDIYDKPIFLLVVLFICIEWLGREQQYAIAKLFSRKPRVYRWSFYYLIILIIFIFAGSNQQFIYFQF